MSNKMRPIIAICFSAIVFIAQTKSVKATPPLPLIDYTIETPNGKYVLVLLFADSLGNPPPDIPPSDLRNKYPHSGLYSQDGKLIWTIDWYIPPVDEWITLLNDGEHLITWVQPMPQKHPSETACDNIVLGFYQRGQELKSYHLRDLVTCPSIIFHSVGGYDWKASYSVNQETQILQILTNDGHILFFDIKNGELIRKLGWQQFLLVLIAIVAIVGFAVIRKRALPKIKRS